MVCKWTGYLIYADEVVIVPKTEDDLIKAMCNGGKKYSVVKWNLTINTDKIKVLVFDRGEVLVEQKLL